MKFVTLVMAAMIISFSCAAQTTGNAAQKRTAAKIQKKTKSQKAKSGSKAATAVNADVITLTDEKAYKAKWTFETMLMRRMEIDAEAAQRQQRKE